MPRPVRFLPLLALPAIAAGALLLGSGASAQAPGSRTLVLREIERGATFVHIRNTKTKRQRSNLQGDVLVFTNPLVDATGAKVGKLAMSCVTTLALLAIPGSTLAWDLPWGGVWIGVPLSVAAIVLGVRARRSLAAKAAIVIAGLALLQMLVWTTASVAS